MTAQSKAGESFRCVCCSEEAPTSEATYDTGYDGPVCHDCHRNTLWAVAYLRKAKIVRPFVQADFNPHSTKRFST